MQRTANGLVVLLLLCSPDGWTWLSRPAKKEKRKQPGDPLLDITDVGIKYTVTILCIDYIRRYIARTHTHSTRRCRNSCHVSINMRRTPQQPAAEDPDVVGVNILPPCCAGPSLNPFFSLLYCSAFILMDRRSRRAAWWVSSPRECMCPSTYQMLVLYVTAADDDDDHQELLAGWRV
jgi:hypothetical protein